MNAVLTETPMNLAASRTAMPLARHSPPPPVEKTVLCGGTPPGGGRCRGIEGRGSLGRPGRLLDTQRLSIHPPGLDSLHQHIELSFG